MENINFGLREVEERSGFSLEMPEDMNTYELTVEGGGLYDPGMDHRALMNRDAPDQHSMESISGLTEVIYELRRQVADAGAAALPPGGTPGQYLRKNPETGDAEWADIEIPSYYGLITYDGNTITVS